MRLRSFTFFAPLLSLLAATTLAGSARAQTSGFALNRFEPSERGSEWFSTDTLDIRGAARPAFGIVGDWGYKPLVIYDPAGAERNVIVEHQVFVHAGLSFVLFERLRLAANLPIAVYQAGGTGTVNGQTFTGGDGAGVGDLRLGADVRLLGQYGTPFVLAFGVQGWLPTGSRTEFTGDESVRVAPRLQVAGDIGPFAYAARASVIYRGLNESFGGAPLGTELGFGASAGLRLADRRLLIGPELFGTTVVVDDGAFAKRTTPVEVIFGGHYTFKGGFRVGLGVGPGVSRGYGSPQVRGLLNLEWSPEIEEVKKGPGDRDGDGVLDDRDACIDKPGVPTNDPATNGCPAAPLDGDNDGILDAEDACPTIAGVKTSDPKTNGCPPDKDGDGIVDNEDACPDRKGVKTDDPKTNGCPPDKDGDTIFDEDDACPDVKGVASTDPKKNGCPPDTDGDGVLDPVDACVDTPGPANADPKKNGCPAAAIVKGEIKILQQVKFKTGSAEILKESDEILTAVSQILKDHPEIETIHVEGHTDNKGSKANNKTLSKNRAAAVVTWLVKKGGIDKKRLTSAGLGDERAIDSNDTEEGRQNNRRVEFHIVKTSGATSVSPAPGTPGAATPAKPATPATPATPAPKTPAAPKK